MANHLGRNVLRFALLTTLTTFPLQTACQRDEPPATPPPAPPPPPPPPPPEHVPPPLEEAAGPSSATDPRTKIIADVGFATPENVYYDADQDVYFVSNINGSPTDTTDDNGFISRLTPDGGVDLKFIDGAEEDVTLNAPKGMLVHEGTLLVADVDTVRLFDAVTGDPKGDIPVKGTTFLNALDVGPDKKTIYLTDSGLTPEFKPSGTDALYKIVDGKVKKVIAEKDIGGPNGVLADVGGAWVVTFRSNKLYFVDEKGKRSKVTKLPQGGLDGIVKTADGTFYVSSWDGSAVYAGKPEGEFVQVVGGVESPAAIGYDSERNRLLIPLFKKDAVVIHQLGE